MDEACGGGVGDGLHSFGRPETTHCASNAACQTIQTKPPQDASDSSSLTQRDIALSPVACSGNVLCSIFVLVNPHDDERPRRRFRWGVDRGPTPTTIRLSGGGRSRRAAMAKGQMRSNKEVRKPKADKPKPPISVASSPFTTPPGKK